MIEGGAPSCWMIGLQMAAMLSIVLALRVGVLYATKRFTGRIKPGSKASIDILCARHIGPKKQVVLLEVMGRRILVGVGSDRITRLETFEAGDLDSMDFAGRLENQMEEQALKSELDGGNGDNG